MKNPLLTKHNIRRLTSFFNTQTGIRFIPYGLGSSYIRWFCRTEFAHKRFFKKKLPIIEEFLERFPGRWDNKKVIAGFFELNYLHGWRASSISHMRAFNFRRRVDVKGLQKIKQSQEEGKGIILLGSHYGLPALSFSAFPRMGFRNFYTILGERGADSVKFKGLNPDRKPKTLIFKRGGDGDAFSMLFEAKEILEDGNILHLLADGGHGKASHHLEFMGKIRAYRATFAELSLLADAPVYPVFIVPSGGKVTINIEDALPSGDTSMEREERVNIMVKAYNSLLESKWQENPSYINGGFIEMYNRMIPV